MIVTSAPTSGYDAWGDAGSPTVEHGSGSMIQLVSSPAKLGYVWLPIPKQARGTTIVSATLTGHAHGAVVSQTISVARIAAKWEANRLNANNAPTTTGSTVTQATGAMNDGDQLTIDVTALVQAIANGSPNYGFRLSTNNATGSKWASFNSGESAWGLTVTYTEPPDPPAGLAPDGTVAGAGKPVVSWDATDFGGVSTDIAAARVEVDYTGTTAVDWDSGWVTQTVNQMDLAAQGMTGTITSGQTVRWRVSVQDSDGGQSAASDWATYTYRPMPTITLDSPTGGTLFDPTATISAHISTALLGAYQIQVTDGDDRSSVRYDSGRQQATSASNIAFTLPLTNADGSRIFTDDLPYQIHVRAWDTYVRQTTPNVPAFVEVWTTVSFVDNGAVAQPTSFQAKQLDTTPFVKLTWSDTTAKDAYLISRDNVHIARLAAADTITGTSGGVSHYTWTDMGVAPHDQSVYAIRSVVTATGRSKPKNVSVVPRPEGVWLLLPTGHHVQLQQPVGDASAFDIRTAERRATYYPVNLPYSVDILTAYEGISGHFHLWLVDLPYQDIKIAHGHLDSVKQHSTWTVRLIFGGFNKPVIVRNMSVLPAATGFSPNGRLHTVDFDVTQMGEFDWTVTNGTRGGVTGVGIG